MVPPPRGSQHCTEGSASKGWCHRWRRGCIPTWGHSTEAGQPGQGFGGSHSQLMRYSSHKIYSCVTKIPSPPPARLFASKPPVPTLDLVQLCSREGELAAQRAGGTKPVRVWAQLVSFEQKLQQMRLLHFAPFHPFLLSCTLLPLLLLLCQLPAYFPPQPVGFNSKGCWKRHSIPSVLGCQARLSKLWATVPALLGTTRGFVDSVSHPGLTPGILQCLHGWFHSPR